MTRRDDLPFRPPLAATPRPSAHKPPFPPSYYCRPDPLAPPLAPLQTPSRVAPRYCRPFVLLATLCTDMGGMKGCEGYKALCATPGSVVAQCKEQPPVPG